ncbi:MAG: hypothetical protein L0H63_10740 [Nitrococcus sp.]|nr:hypothetical protein [Nitrococcus sp.]
MEDEESATRVFDVCALLQGDGTASKAAQLIVIHGGNVGQKVALMQVLDHNRSGKTELARIRMGEIPSTTAAVGIIAQQLSVSAMAALRSASSSSQIRTFSV